MSVKDQCIQEWGDMDAKKRIKILAFDDQTFTQVKEFFKTDHPEDEKVVLNYYLEALYESMQKKIPRHIYNVFENFDETMIANWMTFAYGKKPNENDEWGHMDAKTRIKILASNDQTFTEVKEFFKIDHPEDEKVVLNYYLEALYESMLEKIRRHIYNVLENFDETMIAYWMTFAYGKNSNENDVRNLVQNADFYKCLTDLENQYKSFCFDWVFKLIKRCFQEAFIEIQNLNGIFAIYQCLLRCEHSHHSPTFCNAVRTLCNKCGFENDVVLLEPETNSETDAEHQRLAELVENFTDTHLENVKKLIKDFFKPTNMVFSLLSQGTKQTLAIEGHNITLSAANKEINERIKRNTEIKSVLLRAKHLLILDQDVTLPSVTFACNAAEVVVTKPVKINLSGKDAEVDQSTLKPAKSGKQKGEKGEDGKDGKAGHPSGNFAITAKKLKGKQNLNLILNGGNGTNGQDGGDSAEGEDGVGENFERLDSLKYEFEQGFKRFGRIVSAGIGSSLFNKKVKVKMENGNTELIIETPYYLSLHTIDFVKGSDGKRGECGGKNGLGGEGGKKGKCMIKINGVDHVVKGESRDGQAGQNGLPGKNGGYGLEGWDIAKATKTFGKTRKYGTSFNEKLSVEYTTVKTEGTFCVVAEDEGPESKCYAYIKARKCEKKVLRDHELRTERKDESERSGEAIAQEAVAIETEALDQDYENPINEEVDAEVEQEINEENDFERIIDFCIDLAEDEYVAKERPKQLLFSSKDIENLNIIEENSYFWNSTINVSVENIFISAKD
uniref:Uncharacterized protein n=1 Tax=Panagrolaimus sp. PS1159 TaxID=55785 RepID=A0AC35G781_9BILA